MEFQTICLLRNITKWPPTSILLVAFFFCTVEVFEYLGLLVLAVADAVGPDLERDVALAHIAVVAQWTSIGVMVSILFATWSLLLATWRSRCLESEDGDDDDTPTLMTPITPIFSKDPAVPNFYGRD